MDYPKIFTKQTKSKNWLKETIAYIRKNGYIQGNGIECDSFYKKIDNATFVISIRNYKGFGMFYCEGEPTVIAYNCIILQSNLRIVATISSGVQLTLKQAEKEMKKITILN